jgi:endoglucanase
MATRPRDGSSRWIVVRPVVFTVLVAILGATACVRGSDSQPDPSTPPVSQVASSPTSDAFVQIDQVGYPLGEPAHAYLLARHEVTGATFELVAGDAVAVSGAVGRELGGWSNRFPYVYAIDFSADEPGTYTIRVRGSVVAQSPSFRIATPADLYGPLLVNARSFYRAQRDGPHVIGSVLDRNPSHLHDRHARVYRELAFTPDLVPKLPDPVRGAPRVDASGGWFDAGDYVKGIHTASYAATLLLTARRDFPELLGPGSVADLTGELRFELDWLQRMWDDDRGVLYYQVAVGDGSDRFAGDHDLWRLPEEDDTYAGDDPYYRFIRHRPLFRAGAPESPVSPNLAGRLAASFGLCAQVFGETDPAYAARCLAAGEHIFELADTSPDGRLLTFSPFDYYPETEWHSDLELGAAELALALAPGPRPDSLAHSDPRYYEKRAAHWARAYIGGSDAGGDTLNLYDVSGLAHAELIRAISLSERPRGLEIGRTALLADMSRQLEGTKSLAGRDPFGFGFPYAEYDGTSHAQGLSITASLFDRLTGTTTYRDFGANQLDVILGANAWGASFIVGAGTSFPRCVHHQIANLVGSLAGTPVLLGAAVNGTNSRGEFQYLGLPDHARRCPPGGGDAYGRFDGSGARYWDNVRSWPTVEPAIDFAATTPLAFALIMSPRS